MPWGKGHQFVESHFSISLRSNKNCDTCPQNELLNGIFQGNLVRDKGFYHFLMTLLTDKGIVKLGSIEAGSERGSSDIP